MRTNPRFYFLLLAAFGFLLPGSARTEILSQHSFEQFDFAPHNKKSSNLSVVRLGQSITTEIPPCVGEKSARLFLDSNLSHHDERIRSMFMLKPHPDNNGHAGDWNGINFDTVQGEDFWYGLAVYVPNEWNTSALVWQVKEGFHYGLFVDQPIREIKSNPTVSIHIRVVNGKLRWQFFHRVDPNRPIPSEVQAKATVIDMGPVRKNAWNTLVIHARYTTGNQGLYESWANGKKVSYLGKTLQAPEGWREKERLALRFPIQYSDIHNISFGIYKPELRDVATGKTYTLFVDAFRLGGKNSSYQEVVPKCGCPAASLPALP